MSKPRVVLADDHTLLLEAFERLLADDCEVVGTVSNGRDLLESAASLRPDVIVVDVTMPLMNGLEAARRIRRAHPAIKLIFLTMAEDPDVAAEAFRIGASGYLLKRSAASELVTAIREAANGHVYLTPLVAGGAVASMLNTHARRTALTGRQREVLQLVVEGRSMKEAAAILNITPRTIAFHKYRLMEQLQVRTTAELIQFAVTHHMV